MDDQQPTNQEILEAINSFSSHNDHELAEIKRTMITEERLDARLDVKLDTKFKEKFADFESRLETRFVTKEFFVDKLDEKFADLRGDLVVLVRKEDKKIAASCQ